MHRWVHRVKDSHELVLNGLVRIVNGISGFMFELYDQTRLELMKYGWQKSFLQI